MGARFLPTPARGDFGLGPPIAQAYVGGWRSVGVWWSPSGPLAVGGMGWASSLESRVRLRDRCALASPTINPWMKMTGAAFQSRAASESTADPTSYTPTNSHAATDQPKRQKATFVASGLVPDDGVAYRLRRYRIVRNPF